MLPQDEFLKKHGWVAVHSDDTESADGLFADMVGSGGSVDPVVVEGPSMADIAKKIDLDGMLIMSAAEAFSQARHKVRGQSPMGPSKDSVPSTADGGVEIIKVRPATENGGDSGGASPGTKAIVVDKDRGIIGMQG